MSRKTVEDFRAEYLRLARDAGGVLTEEVVQAVTERASEIADLACGDCHLMGLLSFPLLAIMSVDSGATRSFGAHALVRIERLEEENRLLRERLEDLAQG